MKNAKSKGGKQARRQKRKVKKAAARQVASAALGIEKKAVRQAVARIGTELSSVKARGRGDTYCQAVAYDYIKRVLDPITYPAGSYPDEYNQLTHCYRELGTYDPDFGSALGTSDPRYGKLLVYLRPDPFYPVWSWTNTALTGNLSGHIQSVRQTDYAGLHLVNTGIPVFNDEAGIMQLKSGVTYNVVGWSNWDDYNQYPVPMAQGTDSNGNWFYGMPFDLTGWAPATVTMQLALTQGVAASTTYSLTLVTTQGSVTVTGTSPASISQSFQLTFNVSAANVTTLGGPLAGAAYPGIGFRLSQSTGLPQTVTAYDLWVTQVSGSTAGRLLPQACPDATAIASAVDEWRCTAAAIWCQYVGSDLSNGGQISGCLYRGGDIPFQEQLYNYATIAAFPGAHDGKYSQGAYGYWRPTDPSDVSFREPLNLMDNWRMPTLCIAGNVGTPSQVNSLRVRWAVHYEAKTLEQFLNPKPSVVCPEAIEMVVQHLSMVPPVMENPAHSAEIKKLVNTVRSEKPTTFWGKLKSWYSNNSSWINPLITAGSSLMAML